MCRMPSMLTKGQRRSGHKEDTCKRTTSLEQPTVHLIARCNVERWNPTARQRLTDLVALSCELTDITLSEYYRPMCMC